jgi:hypothetical protein
MEQGLSKGETAKRSLWIMYDVPGIHGILGILPGIPEVIESLGGGWVGEEALAIGLYCALVAGDDFARGVRLAVNHSGDSDSTGAITGNILGAVLGEQAIPRAWLNLLELHDVVCQMGEDLFDTFQGTADWLQRYPPG